MPGKVYWELVFGPEVEDRQVYIDEGDGSFLSQNAEGRLTDAYLQLIKSGVRCGVYRNGALVSGADVLDDSKEEVEDSEVVVHKTWTTQGTVEVLGKRIDPYNSRGGLIIDEGFLAEAICSCGWHIAIDNRALARARARQHRREMAGRT